MRTSLNTLIAASVLVAGIAATPSLYAHDPEFKSKSQTTPMHQGAMMDRDAMMGQNDMVGMMNMMGQMSQMMETHRKMMQSMIDAHDPARSEKQPDKK